MLTPEQAIAVKEQIIKSIKKGFPAEKQEFAKQQVAEMTPEQLEEFLKKNNIKLTSSDSQFQNQCIFCSIVAGQINSYKIDENTKALAVLEINPLAKGHTIIIPKEHIPSSEKIPPQAFSLAKKIGKKIKSKLKPKKVEISSSNLFGHEIISVIPLYQEKMPTERNPAKPEELSELQETLSKTERKIQKIRKGKSSSEKLKGKIWLPRRIP